ncbi:uncharacterized protein G2W53_020693 [Senna tora]|uniref:Uncharacterized protein n=1 Tax=Senna tora TaxID=362788 RepID=A0A834TK31_9FABA|nr:uncharacterized protein G2W53_020693 [Senna tora]
MVSSLAHNGGDSVLQQSSSDTPSASVMFPCRRLQRKQGRLCQGKLCFVLMVSLSPLTKSTHFLVSSYQHTQMESKFLRIF